MELTIDILTKNGFECNHPERPLGNFIFHGKEPTEFRIMAEQQYYPLSNVLGFQINCWKCDGRGAIVKRSSVGITQTVEDLQNVIDLCEIDKKIEV